MVTIKKKGSSKKSNTVDEFSNLAVEDDVNEERIITAGIQQHQIVAKRAKTKHLHSPSISNKIPNSLAFRIKNHEEASQQLI